MRKSFYLKVQTILDSWDFNRVDDTYNMGTRSYESKILTSPSFKTLKEAIRYGKTNKYIFQVYEIKSIDKVGKKGYDIEAVQSLVYTSPKFMID